MATFMVYWIGNLISEKQKIMEQHSITFDRAEQARDNSSLCYLRDREATIYRGTC